MLQQLEEYFKFLEKKAIPQLSINCVILGFHDKTLQIIINRMSLGEKEMLMLPGGYVYQDENLQDTVKRIVKDSTGLENILFKQFAVFGDANRSFINEFSSFINLGGESAGLDLAWFNKRFISICYLALVDYNKIELNPTEFFDNAEWLPVQKAHELSMDHKAIVHSALESLEKELPYSPIESNLLPPHFTLPELHKLFEALLGRPINRPNFRRKMLNSGVLVKVGKDESGKGRPADLYKFKDGRETNANIAFKFGF